ncbi:hypothetical protein D3C74_380030 [compost metagenome]
MREATGEALLQLADIFLRGRRPVPVKIPVNRLTVLTNHVSYIFRTFEAAFNFEGSYPRLDQLRHQVNRRQILRGQEIGDIAHRLDFTIHHQVIRQTAGLRTFPPVGGASAPHFRGQTLARIGDTQRAMHKNLHRQPCLLSDRTDLLQVILAAKHYPLQPPRLRELHRFR